MMSSIKYESNFPNLETHLPNPKSTVMREVIVLRFQCMFGWPQTGSLKKYHTHDPAYVCMYVCMCVLVCICMYVCVCICIRICIFRCVCICIICMYTYVCIYVCMYACMYVYIKVHTRICKYTYIAYKYIHTGSRVCIETLSSSKV